MNCEINGNGISIPGNQKPSKPTEIVESFGDHRIFMSAYILACKVGAKIRGFGLNMIADEFFTDRLSS
jgi:5-enolpyruvylshikimate-3-phosphate synthase